MSVYAGYPSIIVVCFVERGREHYAAAATVSPAIHSAGTWTTLSCTVTATQANALADVSSCSHANAVVRWVWRCDVDRVVVSVYL